MSQVDLLENHIRPTDVEPLLGVEDFTQRRVLFTMKQQIPRQQWKVEHNLGNFPVVSVYDSNNQTMDEGKVTHIDQNNLIIDFPSTDFTGVVQCVVYETNYSTGQNNTTSTSVVDTVSFLTLSNTGKLTVAILTSNFPTLSSLNVSFVNTTTSTEQVVNYNITTTNSDSTWGDLTYVVIKGKKYTVCTFDLTLQTPHNNNLVYFENLNSGDIFILLSGVNRTVYDKITNQLVDVSTVTRTNNQFGFVISNNELVGDTSTVQNVYPHIRPF